MPGADRPIVPPPRPKYLPQEGALLTVDLGGETIRAAVRKLIDPDTVVVEITAATFSRAHSHKQGDMVGCRRERGMFGERWVAVNERVVNEIEQRHQAEAARQPQEEKANAVDSGQQPSGDQRQHRRARPERKAAKTGGSHRPRQRQAAPSA